MDLMHDHADTTLPGLPARELEARARNASARLRRRLTELDDRLAACRDDEERRFAGDAAREVEHMLARVDLHIALARSRDGDEMVELDPRLHAFLAKADARAQAAPAGAGQVVPLRRGA